MANHRLRIHGDNILECESTLKLLASSLNGGHFSLRSGPAYAPIYKLESDNKEYFEIQLFAGYGRWKFPLAEYVASIGGTLREMPDAIVTVIETKNENDFERPVLAFEFSGALPAGNNAWQRTGRALALAYAGIPYLYFAELGGQELDSSRVIKAARFPNPLVPFAYVVLGVSSGSISLPIYAASPSSNKSMLEIFDGCFGIQESIELIKGILLSEDIECIREKIEQKVLKVLEILSEQRKRNDILKSGEWAELYSKKTGSEKAEWLIKKSMPWNKKIGIKKITPSFKKLLKTAYKSGAVAIGSKEMPICLIPDSQRGLFSAKIKDIYKDKVDSQFINWLSESSGPLICVWVAGFKPHGDDSRPDRGLVPLARMIFGVEDVSLLTIIYGPAKPAAWKELQNDRYKLATSNGLWEAIINLSNGIIIDSCTSKKMKNIGFLVEKDKNLLKEKLLPAASDLPIFGEHDIDSILHLLFSHPSICGDIYESMCNPPGGDWSGINILETKEKVELRWTSLPRVSGISSKRPDHLIQLLESRILLSIESKDTAAKLEEKIGPRLTAYVKNLLESNPIAVKNFGENTWRQYESEKIEEFELISGGAFRYQNEEELKTTLQRARVDIIFGIEFVSVSKRTVIHILSNERGVRLIKKIEDLASKLKAIVDIKIH